MSPLRLAASAAALLLLARAGRADDASDLAGLLDEPVVSTASKSAESADLAPATTSVVTAEDLRRFGIVSLDEAINFLSLGMVAEPSYSTPEIGARGVLLSGDYGNHVLLLLDGHALNEPWDGTAYFDRVAAIPLDLVDHIEVILGPGSVLYGSSAMLGVIHVITKQAKDYAGLHLAADGSLPAGGRAAAGYGKPFTWLGREGGITAGVDYSQVRGPTLSYGHQQYGGATWGGQASHRSVEVPAGYLRLVLGDFELAVRAAAARRAATQTWYDFDDPNNWERDRWLSLDARWKKELSARLGVAVRLFGDLYDYLARAPSTAAVDCLPGQASCVYRNSGVSRWGGAELTGTWDWLKDGRYVTLVGVEVRYRHVTSFAAYDDPPAGGSTVVSPFDKRGVAAGAYLQQTLRPVPWLTVNAGLRLDEDYQPGAHVSHLSPRVAAAVPAWRGGTLKAIYSEAFRAPTFYERYYADATYWLAPQHLSPETVRSVEGVVEQRLGVDRLRLSGFRSWWTDLVLEVPATPERIAAAALPPGTQMFTYANASRVDSYGANADLEGSRLHQRLRYGAGVTVAHSRLTGPSGEVSLRAAAQIFGNARVSYDLGGRLPVLALAARAEGPRPVSGADFSPAPTAHPLVELRAAVSGPVVGGLSYRLAGSYSFADTGAYAVGPLRSQQAGLAVPTLLPLPRYQVLFGLRYDQ